MKAASKTLGKAVRPVYRVKNGRPDHLGTCIFLKRSGQHLLMTAAHVTDQSDSYDLHVAVGTKLFPLKGLYGAMSTPSQGSRDKDKYDFAVLTLPPNLVDALAGTNTGCQERTLDDASSDGARAGSTDGTNC